ncbi:MAG: ATP-binding cassette domain-containing protein [Acetobacteraceae bacterium]
MKVKADISLLEDISFDLYPDEIVGIVGRAGSGKSSLLRIAAGLTPHCQKYLLERSGA